MDITKEVKLGVSPTLHPVNITGIPGYEQAKGYISHAATALDASYQAIGDVIETRQKLSKDATRTKKSQVLMAANKADQYMNRIQKSFESSWNRLSSGIDHIEKELSNPMEQYAGIGNVATEIRAHVKKMDMGERIKFLASALEQGDERTLKSVCGAPAYLSGMSEQEQQHTTRSYHIKQNPDVSTRLEVMKQARTKLEQAKPIVFIEMEKAVGATRFELDKLKAANSDAEAALILKEFTPSDI